MNPAALARMTGPVVFIDIADSGLAMRLRQDLAGEGMAFATGREGAEVTLGDGDVSGVIRLEGRHGGKGQLAADASPGQVDAAVRAVAVGLVVRPAEPVSRFRPVGDSSLADLLTPREVGVLDALSDGLSNKGIARRLDISLHTVKFYVEAIFRKLDAHSRAEAVAKGLKRQRADEISL